MNPFRRNRRFLPLLSGLLLTLSFPPFHFLVPPFLALVPLFLYLDRCDSGREALTGGLIFGFTHNLTLLYWISIFSWIGFSLLMVYLTAYAVAWVIIHHFLRKTSRALALIVAPFSWVCLEHLRGLGELAFTWGQLAYSLTGFPFLIQIADTLGPYAISLWIAAVNVLVYLAIRQRRFRALPAGLVVISFFAMIGYGLYRYAGSKSGEEIEVAVIQPGLDQDTKWNPAYQDSITELLVEQTREAAVPGTDLVIWPETALPTYLMYDLSMMTRISELAREVDADLLLGSPHYEIAGGEYQSYNTAVVFHRDGTMDEKVYRKIHLVPFGEKTPWEDRFDFLNDVDLGGGHFTAGQEFTIFEAGSHRIGTLICFESIFPELARAMRSKGANLLVNITNDAWFRRTSAPYQHAAACVLRAIENRVPVARSANTGVSMTVDHLGRIRKSTPIFVMTTFTDTLAPVRKAPPYTEIGDIVLIPCWVVLLAGLLAGRLIGPGPVS